MQSMNNPIILQMYVSDEDLEEENGEEEEPVDQLPTIYETYCDLSKR